MDLRWQEEQRAFQARVLIDETPDLALRPYRTFVGSATSKRPNRPGRFERLVLVLVCSAVLVSVLLSVGVAREIAALLAGIAGGIVLVVGVSPGGGTRDRRDWRPLLAVYPSSVLRGGPPTCVTQISVDEFERLGVEGFGTVVGEPLPGRSFGLFVDDHLVWPRTPPRPALETDPGFGAP